MREFAADPAFDDGLDLARDAANVVVTHTFSKLHGLAALRIGWGYAPLEIAAGGRPHPPAVQHLDRRPARGRRGAGRRGLPAAPRSSSSRRWRPWLTQQLGGLGLEVVGPRRPTSCWCGFPATPGRTAAEADAFLAARGLLVRGVGHYGLPDHLRITIGLEEHNRALVDALADFLAAQPRRMSRARLPRRWR